MSDQSQPVVPLEELKLWIIRSVSRVGQDFVIVVVGGQLLQRLRRLFRRSLDEMRSQVAEVDEDDKHGGKFPKLVQDSSRHALLFPSAGKRFSKQRRVEYDGHFVPRKKIGTRFCWIINNILQMKGSLARKMYTVPMMIDKICLPNCGHVKKSVTHCHYTVTLLKTCIAEIYITKWH